MSEQIRYHVFYSAMPSMQVIDAKGNPIIFVASRFHTKNKEQIDFLNKMIEDGTTSVFVNKDQLTMSDADLDPMEALRRKHIQEYLEQQAIHLDPTQGATESKQGNFNPASTTDIAPVTLGSAQSGVVSQVQAKLAALKATAHHTAMPQPDASAQTPAA